ncbi:MAG: class I SAM-dependent methyltransferase [Streptosporangiales bacterium]|nr:class I SAM-dependent methyltransferase [Streptosporangiales bacterium]
MAEAPLIGTKKANFTDIYTQPDPRRYYKTLSRLDYQIPERALPAFREVLEASRRDGRNRTMLDVCCSYGINSALLLGPDDRQQAASWYVARDRGTLTPDELAEADRRRHTGRHGGLTILGLDVSAPAISYARRAGLLTWGWAEDLESGDPSPELAAGISDVGLIVSTGGVGYVTRRTFEKILKSVRDPRDLWLTIFVLRVFDYSPIVDLLGEYGLVTEKLDVTFRQRRFADDDERDAALADVRARGLDPTGKESTGWFHTDCFVTRPAAEAERISAADLLAPALRQHAA